MSKVFSDGMTFRAYSDDVECDSFQGQDVRDGARRSNIVGAINLYSAQSQTSYNHIHVYSSGVMALRSSHPLLPYQMEKSPSVSAYIGTMQMKPRC